MLFQEDMSSYLFQALEMLMSLPSEQLSPVVEQLLAGLLLLVKTDPSILNRYGKWEVVLHLLSATAMHPEAAKYSFELSCLLINDSGESPVADNFGECVDLLVSFATVAASIVANGGHASERVVGGDGVRGSADKLSGGRVADRDSPARGGSPRAQRPQQQMRRLAKKDILLLFSMNLIFIFFVSPVVQAAIERAIKSLEKLFRLHAKIPKLIAQLGMGHERAWFEFWLPLLSGLGQQCYHPSREVRQCGLTLLQRALLSPELESSTSSGTPSPVQVTASQTLALTSSTFDTGVDCFENVLFPLLDELLKLDVFKLDPTGMDETRMRASALLCKIFLQYLPRLLRFRDLPELWIKILDYLCRYLSAGGNEFLVSFLYIKCHLNSFY
jgi:hypothetical protein